MVTKDDDMPDGRNRKNPPYTSPHVTNHLANERTFLAWIRTGLATISIGFVVARFSLFLREIGMKSEPIPYSSLHYSAIFGVALSIIGLLAIVIALVHFLQVRSDIDHDTFHPRASYAIVLSALAILIGIGLSIYLLLTS